MIEQDLAGLDVGDDRRARLFLQHRLGEDHQQLVAPDDAALGVDRTDPVGVAVERNAEVELLLGDERLQVRKIGFDRGIGMMVRKGAVDFSVDRVMLPRAASR